jgi:AdoMet-dependent rRNA methyltransferase SPB1
LRSRAAFKLSQINRQYPILDPSTKVVLDLCAAPGGWTQIASRECGPQTHIIAVDILPIRKIYTTKNQQTITTIVGDITTDKCKAEITRAIASVAAATNTKKKQHANEGQVDVVLHDGAPNIGASYDKDAYEQMEISVHALRCATQHLKRGGTFVTKIYRSRDSASYQWVIQQLFETVTSFKPKASRPQSSEIFYVCQGYHAPQKLDPRLLDPKHIFEMVQGDTTGGSGVVGTNNSTFHVFHKKWDHAKRHRDGYDNEHLDMTLRHVEPLDRFVFQAKGSMGAIHMLSSCTGFSFTCEECTASKKEDETQTKCHCQFLLHHPLTTPEIKECVVDLKVLNKGDFKGLMIWRDKMILAMDQVKESDDDEDDKDGSDEEEANLRKQLKGSGGDEEDEVQKEIQALRERKLREKKKIKKKERKLAAKKRRHAALGMDLNAIEVQEDDQFFSLSILKSSGDLQKVAEVNLDRVTDEQVFGADSDDDDDDDDELGINVPDKDEGTGYSFRLENDLDIAYNRYLESTKNGLAKSGTKASKRSKKLMREKLAQESHEDHELLLTNQAGLGADAKTYAQLLQGPKDSDDEDDSEGDEEDDGEDGFHSKPMTPREHERQTKKQKIADPNNYNKAKEDSNPLIHQFPDDPTSIKTARWFSNPLFASIGQAAESAQEQLSSNNNKKKTSTVDDVQDDDQDVDDEEMPKAKRARRGKKGSNKDGDDDDDDDDAESSNKKGLDADAILAMIPKTDKEKRHEKRLKALERDARRQTRKAKKLGDSEGEFALAPAGDENEDDEEDQEREIAKMEGISEEKKQKLLEARKLIKAGMGISGTMNDDANDGKGFEVVEADRPLPALDTRKYDSDHEEYDSDDYAKTMALGTMMLRKSKTKALVDASYNRYAWNDPQDLPEWFVDDENRHYRPQLPIPDALLQKMKDKMVALSTRPIAKVAEARARKSRKAKLKLASAKKKAQALAGSSEMSESMKLKQISKALRSADGKKGGKELILSKKGKKGVKGAVMVDKREKNDKRSMERSQKKRKSGKKGGLTGSKKRRHHG